MELMEDSILIKVFNQQREKRAKIVDTIHGHRIAILTVDFNLFGYKPTDCHTFLIETENGMFHPQDTWPTLLAHRDELTEERVKQTISYLLKLEGKS